MKLNLPDNNIHPEVELSNNQKRLDWFVKIGRNIAKQCDVYDYVHIISNIEILYHTHTNGIHFYEKLDRDLLEGPYFTQYNVLHCKKRHFVPNRYIYLKQILNTVQSDWNYLEQKQIIINMLCNNKFTLKQIDILHCFNVTLIQIDISIWYKVVFFTVQNRVHDAVFGFKEAGLKLVFTMRVLRFMQSVISILFKLCK